MDKTALLLEFDGDPELLEEVINVFLKDYPTHLIAIREGIELQDLKRIERGAHALKGTVGLFGENDVIQTALHLQGLAAGGVTTHLKETHRLLELQIHSLQTQLEILMADVRSDSALTR